MADLDLDRLDQDHRENGGGHEKVHGGERRVRREGGGTSVDQHIASREQIEVNRSAMVLG